jgi:hypothetical protein
MNARARNFLAANEVSPVVYGSVDSGCVTYRLADGKTFRMTPAEASHLPRPWWAHYTLQQHRNEELILLAKVQAEQGEAAKLERVLAEARG